MITKTVKTMLHFLHCATVIFQQLKDLMPSFEQTSFLVINENKQFLPSTKQPSGHPSQQLISFSIHNTVYALMIVVLRGF